MAGHAFRTVIPKLAILAGLAAYIGGAGYVSALGVSSAHDLLVAWETLPSQSIIEKPSIDPGPDVLGDLPVWNGKERVNILLMGVDVRPDEAGNPGRTDFIGVLTIDPATKSAGLISFPRDLWVDIPAGQGNIFPERINAAYLIGETFRNTGGGAATARRMIEYNFGIRTHFYAMVDFQGFVHLIDQLGGIKVDVPKPLKDDEYPTMEYGYKRIYYPAGIQEMDGNAALEYARSRHADTDFARNQRQQRVLLAARQKALQLDLLPALPKLLVENKDYIKTDLNPLQIMALARLSWGVDSEDITLKTLDQAAATGFTGSGGASLLMPNMPLIQRAIDEVFSDPHVKREAARVLVIADRAHRNGANRLLTALTDRGIKATVEERTSPDSVSTQTNIVQNGKTPATTLYLRTLLSLEPAMVSTLAETSETADIEIFVADDLSLPREGAIVKR